MLAWSRQRSLDVTNQFVHTRTAAQCLYDNTLASEEEAKLAQFLVLSLLSLVHTEGALVVTPTEKAALLCVLCEQQFVTYLFHLFFKMIADIFES